MMDQGRDQSEGEKRVSSTFMGSEGEVEAAKEKVI